MSKEADKIIAEALGVEPEEICFGYHMCDECEIMVAPLVTVTSPYDRPCFAEYDKELHDGTSGPQPWRRDERWRLG